MTSILEVLKKRPWEAIYNYSSTSQNYLDCIDFMFKQELFNLDKYERMGGNFNIFIHLFATLTERS